MKPKLSSSNPYPGPRPFEREEEGLFFGRRREVRELLSIIIAHRAVLIYAQSGAGKTSLLNAGIIPLLVDEGFDVLPVTRVRGLAPEDGELRAIPNIYVFNALMGWVDDRTDPRSLASMTIASFLREREHPTDRHGLPLPRLIIFDQFEELFTFYLDHWEKRKGFFQQVAEALEADPLLRVLFVIREDYLGSLDPYGDLLPDRLRARFRLDRLRAEPAHLAIEAPLQGSGRSFAEGVASTLAQKLLTIQLESSTGEMVEAAGEYAEPVQLQVVCQNLWLNLPPDVTRITLEHLQAFGDVDDALRSFYEKAIKQATRDTGVKEGDLRTWFDTQLITPAGTRGTVFRGQERTGGMPNETVKVLENEHIIRAELRAGAHWYELTHDRFIGPIRSSNQEWLSERWQVEQTRRQLEAKAAEWVRLGRGSGGLLDEVELMEAQRWLDTPGTTELTYSEDVSALVKASRTAIESAKRKEHQRALVLRGALVILSLAVVLSWYFYYQAQQQTKLARAHGLRARAISLLGDEFDLALLLGLEASRAAETIDARVSLFSALGSTPHIATFLRGHAQNVNGLAFSRDSTKLAASSGDSIFLWDLTSIPARGHSLSGGHKGPVHSLAFSPDGKTVATGGADYTIILWDVTTREKRGNPLEGHDGAVRSLAFSKDGKTLASGSADTSIYLWDLNNSQPRAPRKLVGYGAHWLSVIDVAFSPDGKTLASGSADKTTILWDLASDKPPNPKRLEGHSGGVYSVAFSPDGKTLASASGKDKEDKTIILWDVATPEPRSQKDDFKGDIDPVLSTAFSPDGKTLALGRADNTIILWDVQKHQSIGSRLTGHGAPVLRIAFSPDGKKMASFSKDNTIILWDLSPRLVGHGAPVHSVAFSPDGKTLASGSGDYTIILWDVATRQPLGDPLKGHGAPVYSVAFSPDGKTVASGSCGKVEHETIEYGTIQVEAQVCRQGEIRLWDIEKGKPTVVPLPDTAAPVLSVAFSPDGKTLASGSGEGTIILWDVATHKQPTQKALGGHGAPVYSLVFSPDGKTLASGSCGKFEKGPDDCIEGEIRLWELTTDPPFAKLLGEPLAGHRAPVLSLAFSRPDGKTVASGSGDNTIILWDVATRQPLGDPLKGHGAPVYSVAFTKDGKILASGSGDNTIILWDVDSRKPLGLWPLTGHAGTVRSVAFAPNGKTLASGSADNTIMLWDVDSSFESMRTRACRIAGRNLSGKEWETSIGKRKYDKTCQNLPLGDGVAQNAQNVAKNQ